MSAVVILLIGAFLFTWLWRDRAAEIELVTENQLSHIEFSVANLFMDVQEDLLALLSNPAVRVRDSSSFTSFLGADPDSFRYDYGPAELQIIRLFNDYRLAHPSVNSVYMGRSDGSFVRSHPRERPTAYDPRDRPWYLLAAASPGAVVRSAPYPALTTKDVNVSVATAMLDNEGRVYGVLGMDVTLLTLTKFLSDYRFYPSGSLILSDGEGTILSAPEEGLLFSPLAAYAPVLEAIRESGADPDHTVGVGGKDHWVSSRRLGDLGWTAFILTPGADIARQILRPVAIVLSSVAGALVLLSVLVLLGLNLFILKPLSVFSAETARVAGTMDFGRPIPVTSQDEIGDLEKSWNEMLSALSGFRSSLQEAQRQLEDHRDSLEETVRERTASLMVEKERAEAADRLKSAFLATMSHELRTPLNSIIGFTGIILKGLVGPLTAEQEKQLGMVMGSAKHLLALINDVLDISKIEAGQLTITDEDYELGAVIDKAVLSAKPLAEKKGIELLRKVEGPLPPMRGDARRVEQILLNLISNAVKFTEKGSVTVSCAKGEGFMLLEVEDTGIGIKDEDMDKLFQAFRQIDSGLSRKYEGTGLGLSISQRLVKLMGGEISVRSRWGQGSVFSFTLPLRGSAS